MKYNYTDIDQLYKAIRRPKLFMQRVDELAITNSNLLNWPADYRRTWSYESRHLVRESTDYKTRTVARKISGNKI